MASKLSFVALLVSFRVMKQAPSTPRIKALDYTKGVGIVAFVYWHSISYTYSPGIWTFPPGRFIHFATGMFVYLAGLLVGFHYDRLARTLENVKQIYSRLISRGLKLIAIYSVGLFVKRVLQAKAVVPDLLYGMVTDTATLFYVDRWDLPLQILVVIGSYLVIAPICILLSRRGVSWVSGGVIVAALVGEVLWGHPFPYFWHYLLVGIFGGLVGLLVQRYWIGICSAVKAHFCVIYGAVLLVFLTIEVLVTISEPIYHRFLGWTSLNLLSVSAAVLAWGLPFFWWIDLYERRVHGFSWLSMIGRYSLLVYVMQITALTLGKSVGLLSFSTSYLAPIVLAIILIVMCTATAFVTSWFCRYPTVDRIYRAIFS